MGMAAPEESENCAGSDSGKGAMGKTGEIGKEII
jgi:hypothetical protein